MVSLSNVQLEILQAFSFQMSDDQLADFRQYLVTYFADRIDRDMDQLFEDNNWSVEEKVAEWGSEHLRTPYKTDR